VTLLLQQSAQLPLAFTASVSVNYFPRPDCCSFNYTGEYVWIMLWGGGGTLGEAAQITPMRNVNCVSLRSDAGVRHVYSSTCSRLDDANPTETRDIRENCGIVFSRTYFVLSPQPFVPARGFGMRVVGGKTGSDGRTFACIVWTVPGGPAEKAGLQQGDKVR